MTASLLGPFGTEREALDRPEVRAIYDAMHASLRGGVGDEENLRLLDQACKAAGVELGAYDRRILAWLAGWEAQVCAVVAGMVGRAHAAAGLTGDRQALVVAALEEAAADRTERAAGDGCSACADSIAMDGMCPEHRDHLTRAGEYRAAAEEIGGQQ